MKAAYETLADDDKRREYDVVQGTRRMNFFRDVDFEAEEQQGWGRPAYPFEVHRWVLANVHSEHVSSIQHWKSRQSNRGAEERSSLGCVGGQT